MPLALWRCLFALLAAFETSTRVEERSSLQLRRLLHEDSHFSKRGGGPFLCESAEDVRANCTRCAPRWRGLLCNERVAVAPCTLHHCLDFSRCRRGAPHTLHVYTPPRKALAAYVTAHGSAVWQQLVTGLRQSRRHVADPAEACLLVPWFDTLCTSNDCTNPKVRTCATLQTRF
jgi:hypothetical protein